MLYYAYGTALLTDEEVRDLGANEKARDLAARTARREPGLRKLDLENGSLTPDMLRAELAATDETTPWQPTGLGKPLTIDIREVYTGRHPQARFFDDTRPMLLTSAVKSITTYEAKPRAINYLSREVRRGTRLQRPRASSDGTPVLFYSPATIDRSLSVDLEIVFDKFPEEAFDAVSRGLTAAAGIPVFVSASFYLLAAGEIARIAGIAGQAIFDGHPEFQDSVGVDLDLPGTTRTQAGFMLIAPDPDRIDPTFRSTYHVVNGSCVDVAGRPYTGDLPYIILAVDGTARDDLANFAPTAASAAVLQKFFGAKDGQNLTLDPLIDALKLFNDMRFRTEVDKIDKQLATTQDGDEKTRLTEKRAALLKNIGSDLLKPKTN